MKAGPVRLAYSSTCTRPTRLCSTSCRLAAAPADAREHARIGRRIDHPVDGRQRVDVARRADVAVEDLHAQPAQPGAIGLRTRAHQVVDAEDRQALPCVRSRPQPGRCRRIRRRQ